MDVKAAITAVRASSGFSERRIKAVLSDLQHGIEPLRVPGTIDWEIFMCYRTIEEYERERIHTTGEGG